VVIEGKLYYLYSFFSISEKLDFWTYFPDDSIGPVHIPFSIKTQTMMANKRKEMTKSIGQYSIQL
jgi:hypothetical protein